jgi:hypothetical protein
MTVTGLRALRSVSAVAIALAVGACASPSQPTPSATASSSAVASSAVASEQLLPRGSHFDSPLYAYAIELPDGWRPEPAGERWDGKYGSVGSDAPSSDQFFFQKGYSAWAFAAPTDATLRKLVEGANAADARLHECEAKPATVATSIGGEKALLGLKHCPTDSATVLGTAAAIHNGVGYFFYFIHPEVIAASDDDRQVFQSLLDTVVFE